MASNKRTANEKPSTLIEHSKSAAETFPLKLTEPQRAAVLKYSNLSKSLQQRFEQAGEGTQVIDVAGNEVDLLDDEIGQAAAYARSPDKQRLLAVLKKLVDFNEQKLARGISGEAPKSGKGGSTKGALLFQFKISLLKVNPVVWRRIQVPDCTLGDLHDHIQAVFGWEGYHMHAFRIDNVEYGPAEMGDNAFDMEFVDESEVSISQLISQSSSKPRWIYEYDFGDGWEHAIVFEGNLPADPKAKYPRCVEGKRACPPEDCGGPWGYNDYLDALADPKHEQHEEMLEWRGGFDPEAFDAAKATKRMR